MKAFYDTNNRWPGLKKIFKYIWDPEYKDPQNPNPDDMEDGGSVGDPEAKIAQTKDPLQITLSENPSEAEAESPESSSADEDDQEKEVKRSIKATVSKILKEYGGRNLYRRRGATMKRVPDTNMDRDLKHVISPFAVCGGHRVGSLRQIFNPVKTKTNTNHRLRWQKAAGLSINSISDELDSQPDPRDTGSKDVLKVS